MKIRIRDSTDHSLYESPFIQISSSYHGYHRYYFRDNNSLNLVIDRASPFKNNRGIDHKNLLSSGKQKMWK